MRCIRSICDQVRINIEPVVGLRRLLTCSKGHTAHDPCSRPDIDRAYDLRAPVPRPKNQAWFSVSRGPQGFLMRHRLTPPTMPAAVRSRRSSPKGISLTVPGREHRYAQQIPTHQTQEEDTTTGSHPGSGIPLLRYRGLLSRASRCKHRPGRNPTTPSTRVGSRGSIKYLTSARYLYNRPRPSLRSGADSNRSRIFVQAFGLRDYPKGTTNSLKSTKRLLHQLLDPHRRLSPTGRHWPTVLHGGLPLANQVVGVGYREWRRDTPATKQVYAVPIGMTLMGCSPRQEEGTPLPYQMNLEGANTRHGEPR